MEMIVRPSSPSGLLFYNGYKSDRRGDFISIALVNSFVEARFDLITGVSVLKAQKPVEMNHWHVITVTRTGREGENLICIMSFLLAAFFYF